MKPLKTTLCIIPALLLNFWSYEPAQRAIHDQVSNGFNCCFFWVDHNHIQGNNMQFSQKKVCKGCQLEGLGVCRVRVKKRMLACDVPLEPCFKPKTNEELSAFNITLQQVSLDIHRAKA